jgi:hypothetical protein
MTTAIVQKRASTPATGTTHALAFAGAVTAGNTLFASISTWHSGGGSSITQIRDNVNGAVNYTLVKSLVQTADTEIVALYMFPNTAAGTPTVTATISVSNDNAMEIFEVSGLGAAPTLDGTPVATIQTSVTAHVSGNLVTSATSTIFGVYGDSGYNTTVVPTVGQGWTDEIKNASSAFEQNAVETRGVGAGAAASTFNSKFTTGAATSSVVMVAAYQVSGAAAAVQPRLTLMGVGP